MSTIVTPSEEQAQELRETNGNQRKRKGGKRLRSREFSQVEAGRDKGVGPEIDWKQWSTHLRKRKSPVALAAVFGGQRHTPLLWAALETAAARSSELLERLHVSAVSGVAVAGLKETDELAELAGAWLKEVASRPVTSELAALELLGWTYALPSLTVRLEPAVWWRMLDFAVAAANEAASLSPAERPLENQLLAGELAHVLATLFPEVARCAEQSNQARQALVQGVEQLLDEGLPDAHHLRLHRMLLACWTRCEMLSRENRAECLTKSARKELQHALRQMFRLARRDGGQMLSGEVCTPPTKAFLKSALDVFGDRDDRVLAALALGLDKSLAKRSHVCLPQPSDHSEWAEAAILRTAWSSDGEALAVTYHGREFHSELQAGKRTVWSGRFEATARVDGEPLAPVDDWQEVCWTADDDVDYLELEMKLSRGWKLQRQLCLAREDRVLLVADALIGVQRGRIEYRAAHPLRPHVRFATAEESNEGFLVEAGNRFSLVLPLALPEWRAKRGPGRLLEEDGQLVYSLQGDGQALYAPLFFDLKPSRVKQPFTWRRLTVAQDLVVQPADVAVGYRVQVGSWQWLIYCTLADPAPRTVLGQHLSSDFYFGRFDLDGEVEDLVEVETE